MKTTAIPRPKGGHQMDDRLSAVRGPEICNVIRYKLSAVRRGGLLLIALLAAANAPGAAPCCSAAPSEDSKPKTVPGEATSPNFSPESLYQLDGTFTTDAGRTFALGELRGRPVVLDLFFASCGYACPLTVSDLLALQARLPAGLRREAVFVLVSFDTTRDTTEVLAKYRTQRRLNGQWILLRGSDDSVRELAALVGVKYKQEADGAFAHSNLFTILNREGEIVHQRTGLKGGLDEAATVLARLAPVSRP